VADDEMELFGLYFDEENQQARRGVVRGSAEEGVTLAHTLANDLKG
jgi:hypothetical protein